MGAEFDLIGIVHKVTGDEKTVRIMMTLETRPIIVIRWTGCGDYALHLEKNELFGYGPGFGVRRTPTGWGAKDLDSAWNYWHAKKDEWRKRNPVRTRSARARDQKFERYRRKS
jgi:glycogen synthase